MKSSFSMFGFFAVSTYSRAAFSSIYESVRSSPSASS